MFEKLRAYSMAKELSMDRAWGGVDDDEDDDTDDDGGGVVSEAEEVMDDEVAMRMDKWGSDGDEGNDDDVCCDETPDSFDGAWSDGVAVKVIFSTLSIRAEITRSLCLLPLCWA